MTSSDAPSMAVSPPMNSREVAAYLKVSESTLSRWRAAGTGPPFLRPGGIARYGIDAVDAWLGRLESDHASEDRAAEGSADRGEGLHRYVAPQLRHPRPGQVD